MSTPLQIVCTHCQAINRVPAERSKDAPNCGKCHRALFDGHPAALDEAAFDRQIANSSVPVVVDFWASWCGPCKSMAPEFEKAAKTLEPTARLAKVDTDAAPTLAQRFGIRSIPTLIAFRGGREVARQSGAMGAAQIADWVRAQG